MSWYIFCTIARSQSCFWTAATNSVCVLWDASATAVATIHPSWRRAFSSRAFPVESVSASDDSCVTGAWTGPRTQGSGGVSTAHGVADLRMQLPQGCSPSQRFLFRAQAVQAREGRPRERGMVALAGDELSVSNASSSVRRADLIAEVSARARSRRYGY